jgi:class 3 adenylate cyclase
MAAMKIRPVCLLLIDISGYTRFTKLHRLSALHAEKIIGDLLESIIGRASPPLRLHEILGDAVSFYADAQICLSLADEIRRQVASIFDAFRLREGELISDCSLCICEACRNVGKLQLKAILHRGEAVFSKVAEFQKISGEDVILAHRLLKNSVPSREYILETEPFYRLGGGFPELTPDNRIEMCAEFGRLPIRVFYPTGTATTVRRRTLSDKLKRSFQNDWYSLQRLFGRRAAPPSQSRSETASFGERTHIILRRDQDH